MPTTQKVWSPDDEAEPEGLSNLKSAPPNWFREEPQYAAELYGLERGNPNHGSVRGGSPSKTYRVHVLDDSGTLHKFNVKVAWTIVAQVESIS